ncbi:MAG: GTPase ObgE [Dehalococcoidia bacterium]
MIDRVEISVKAGDGGPGIVHFRREKFVPRGGPDGGDGGRGGNVYLVASHDTSTLSAYRYRHNFRAENGGHGSGNNRHGRKGEDLQLTVPVGTTVMAIAEDGASSVLADITEPGEPVLIARGGRGGWGNTHFKSSTNQAPKVAQSGQAGQDVKLVLDLRLIADAGVIGRPNAGKSSFVTTVSAARPRIADYPFTTLEPVLGVVELGFESFVVAEIPGLIEGAAEGAGLGHEFLRHAERSKVFLHLIDGSREDPLEDYRQVNAELLAYDPALAERRQLVAINKLDLPEVEGRRAELDKALRAVGVEPWFISAAVGTGVEPLLKELLTAVREATAEQPVEEAGVAVLRPRPVGRRFRVEKTEDEFRVYGVNVEVLSAMMDIRDDATREEFVRQLERMGVAAALQKAGVQPGDSVRVGDASFQWAL